MWTRLSRCEQGVGAVEFALTLPILVALMVAVADFGLAANEKMRLSSAARAGAQAAYRASGDTAGVSTAVRLASGLDAARLTIVSQNFCGCMTGGAAACDSACADGNGLRTYVSVSVSETWEPLIVSTFMDAPITLTGSAVLRVK